MHPISIFEEGNAMNRLNIVRMHLYAILVLALLFLLPAVASARSIYKTWGDISLSYPDENWKLLSEASIRNFQHPELNKKILIALNSHTFSEVGADALFRLSISWDYENLNQYDLTMHRAEYDRYLPDEYRQIWAESDRQINTSAYVRNGKIPRQESRIVEARIIDFKGRKAILSHRIIQFASGKEKDSFLITIPLAPYAIVINYNCTRGRDVLLKEVEGILHSVDFSSVPDH